MNNFARVTRQAEQAVEAWCDRLDERDEARRASGAVDLATAYLYRDWFVRGVSCFGRGGRPADDSWGMASLDLIQRRRAVLRALDEATARV